MRSVFGHGKKLRSVLAVFMVAMLIVPEDAYARVLSHSRLHAKRVRTSTANFAGIFSSLDTTAQKAFDTLDDVTVESFGTSLTAGSVPFSDGTTLVEDNANFSYNNATNALTVSGMTFDAGSITDLTGAINFGDEDLITTGKFDITSTSTLSSSGGVNLNQGRNQEDFTFGSPAFANMFRINNDAASFGDYDPSAGDALLNLKGATRTTLEYQDIGTAGVPNVGSTGDGDKIILHRSSTAHQAIGRNTDELWIVSGANSASTQAFIRFYTSNSLTPVEKLEIGDNIIANRQFMVDGTINEVQLLIQGFSTQTNPLITAEQSDGTDVFTVSNAGRVDGEMFALPLTTSSTVGVINQGANRFIHTFDVRNIFMGDKAGNFTMSSTNGGNVGIGFTALDALTDGEFNFGLGSQALSALTEGKNDIGIGRAALFRLTIGDDNIGIGRNAGIEFASSSSGNTVIGTNSFEGSSSGIKHDNVSIGNDTASQHTGTPDRNTIIGTGAGLVLGGDDGVFIGYNAGAQYTGSDQLFIDVTNTTTPLIGGDFSARTLTYNANAYTFGTAGDVDISFTFNANTNDGVMTWMEDEDAFSFDDKVIVGGTTPDSLFEADGAEGLAIETVTGNTTLDAAHSTVLVNCSSDCTMTLPTAASSFNNTDGIGRIYEIKKIDADADTVTVDGNGAEEVEFAATLVLTTQGESVTITTNGTAWFVI